MAIFKISKGRADVALKEKAPEPTDAEEMKQAMGLVGELPVKKEGQEEEIERNAPGGSVEEKKKEGPFGFEDKPVIVKVDGPLGRVFTEALNKILAFEGMAAIPVDPQEVPEVGSGEIISVHVLDVEHLENEDVVHISDEITKEDNTQHVISAEHAAVPGFYRSGQMAMTRLTGKCLAAQQQGKKIRFADGLSVSVGVVSEMIKERLHAQS